MTLMNIEGLWNEKHSVLVAMLQRIAAGEYVAEVFEDYGYDFRHKEKPKED